MSQMNTKPAISITRLLPAVTMVLTLLLTASAHAAAPGIQGTSFSVQARDSFISQPDGAMVYSWGYGCVSTSGNTFVPAAIPNANCPTMQIPGPTLIVTEGQPVSITLTNNLPAAAGNTSILFPGFQVSSAAAASQPAACTATTAATQAPQGLLTLEAAPNCSVTYTFTAGSPGTRAYYSGTQGDLQVEMGLYGTIIVLPNSTNTPSCPTHNSRAELETEQDFRLSPTGAAYHVAGSCYDREYLFQFSEMDPKIHRQAEEIALCVTGPGITCPVSMNTVATEPYQPAYFMINGRSMPDDMDPNYSSQYPHQPYNGNPHMHPGELVLLRVVGTGRWQHPFHEHGNHVRTLARDGNLIVSQGAPTLLAGPLLFTTTTTPGLAYDGIFYWTGKGLNWDVFGHNAGNNPTCSADANGYYTDASPSPAALTASNYYEWCQDHLRPLEAHPFGDVGAGGPVTLPDATILADGPWYGGSPYLGPEATGRAVSPTPIPPSGTVANDPGSEAGFAFMWHSHNERELTTNNSFPGGMMMMMLVDPRAFVINESN